MTTRVTTQYFDQVFQTVGIPVAQFSLLADIAFRESVTISELAEILLRKE